MTEPALTDLLAEIAEMRDKPVPDSELADAKRAIVAQLRAVARESADGARLLPRQLALQAAGGLLGHVPAAHQRGDRRGGTGRGAKKYWEPDRLQIVAVGDATKITELLRKKGELEVYDAEGKEDRDHAVRTRIRSPMPFSRDALPSPRRRCRSPRASCRHSA